ncbi:uncharacterized protein LOC124162699 [Ischnura elegans]|uniref:uncharacterized protein LOC124162699 n=1 Tax=Ischnura elegans TaxID=197161 RepID=UPI001ED88D99|nr:uncharacterized protein LOC124162699 [Ischnura elegans]
MASRIFLVSALAAILIIGFVSCQEPEESNDVIPDIASSKAPVENITPEGSDASGPEVVTESSPPSASNMFTRLIHDIFQIPIQVLRAVRNMLSAQNQQKPENQ